MIYMDQSDKRPILTHLRNRSLSDHMPLQTIPTLTTERLFLRPPVVGDFPAYALLLSSPRANYMGGPYAQRAAWGLFCHDVACWELFGHGGLMIDLRTTGECVGRGRHQPRASIPGERAWLATLRRT